MELREYIAALNLQFQTGVAREHAYRPALQQFLSSLMPYAIVTNEPAKIACGAPDFIITDRTSSLPIAFFEAKDIDDSDLDGRKAHKEQFTRYKNSLDTIVFTDYLDFHLYEYGEWVENVRIGEVRGEKIVLLKENEPKFLELISHVGNSLPQKITSASKLATMMASKARLLAETIKQSFSEENNSYDNRQLQGQYEAFKKVLIHDLTTDAFSDIYAQTIAYGMFAARLHDPTPDDFSRIEAATLIPKSNPFLRQIFQSIAGFNIDDRISWIVDDLVATFQSTDITKIMGTYSKDEIHNDPMIHFYEDFLAAYDPQLRKAKGVWYTPQPVVQFIVKSVDEILQKDFNLPMGLADSGKVKWNVVNEQYTGKKGETKTITKEFHRVQILDPATGTGTFLAEVIRQVYAKFENMKGMWQGYVEDSLLPRLNGFEILMASYAVAHLKLDMLLKNTGYNHIKDSRFKVFLTNSLEECDPDTGTLFSTWLSDEATEANYIKRDCPVMVMLGNPPYSGISANNGDWITNLIEEYKKEPGGKIKLQERKIWLNDDYVKFLRLAQMYVDRTGTGIVAYINNNGFLNNPTFRGMRWNLMRSFDKIYVLNLHGNSQKKETAPDGGKDENVFDIMVGTSINIFIKTGKKGNSDLAEVYYSDVYGERDIKYNFLREYSFSTVEYTKVSPAAPFFFWNTNDYSSKSEYEKGFSVEELFCSNVMGVTTARDRMVIDSDRNRLLERIRRFVDTSYSDDETRQYFFGNKTGGKYLPGDSRGWSMSKARNSIRGFDHDSMIIPITYRPFDNEFIYYCQEMVDWPRMSIMRHLQKENVGLCAIRINSRDNEHTYFVTDNIMDKTLLSSKDNANVFPLYLYGEDGKRPNLNREIWDRINSSIGRESTPDEILGYIYGVLYSNSYREKFKEFLKVDFPRVPYPKSEEQFTKISEKGNELVLLHLMKGSESWPMTVTFPESGDNLIEELSWTAEEGGRVNINKRQYLGNVSSEAWESYIGGYQPAQKWLKDRKGRVLGFQDILHYGRILYALEQTNRIMEEIDSIGVV